MSDNFDYGAFERKMSGDTRITREEIIELFNQDPFNKYCMWKKLKGLDLSGIKFPSAEGHGIGAEFRGTDLTHTNFSKSSLQYAHFFQAILQNANFSKCNLTGAIFGESDIRGTNFSGANLYDANFSKAVYDSHTIFPMFFKIEKHAMIKR